mgnify:CR=1 FL=1|jgi:hypothetical protein
MARHKKGDKLPNDDNVKTFVTYVPREYLIMNHGLEKTNATMRCWL